MPVISINNCTIIGFGNQAKAWALNLKDSGFDVYIGLREDSKSHDKAKSLGLKTFILDKEPIPTLNFALLTPDETHQDVLSVLSNINADKNCIYAHGFSITSRKLHLFHPNFNHYLMAPKAIASELRFRFQTKDNLTAFYSLEFGDANFFETLEAIAFGLGINNLYPTTFEEETKADLFSEQSILCSLLPYGINEAFNTLVNRGYSKELAFFECFYESKLIIDTLFKLGPDEFFKVISPNALLGSEVGKLKLFDDAFREKLSELLDDIERHRFNQLISSTDIDQTRKQVSKYWKSQELEDTYSNLKARL